MQVTLEKSFGLERKLTVTVPAEKVVNEVETELRKIAAKVKIPGFRPGKIPFDIIQKNYKSTAESEVLRKVLQDTYADAIKQEKLNPAGLPRIDLISSKSGEPLVYTATLEVYPEIRLNDLKQINVEKSIAQVTDSDVDEMLERMRQSNVTWQEAFDAKYKSKKGDQVTIDFTIKTMEENNKDGEGKVEKDVKFVLGKGEMWNDFEQQLYDVGIGEEKKFTLQMPATHVEKNLAGKFTDFTVKVNKICQPILPDLNDDFAVRMRITEGGIAKLKEEVRGHMERELVTALQEMFKKAIMDKLLEHNPIEVPKALIEYGLEKRAEEWQKQMVKYKSKESLEKKPEFPRNDLEPYVKRNVALGLLLSAVVKEQEIRVEPQDVHKKIEDMVSTYYEDKEEMVNRLLSDQQYFSQIESTLLEEKVVTYLASQVNLTEKNISYKEAMAKK